MIRLFNLPGTLLVRALFAPILTLLLCLVHPSASSAPSTGVSSYALGAGDQIAISVFGEEDLSMEIMLNDAGSFSYPFLGELMARGLTVSQLQQLIVNGLKGPYLIDPKVSVTIVEYRRFFVNGEVKSPGGFPFEPGLTLRKAISIAGGFTDRASRSKFTVISDTDASGEPQQAGLSDAVRPGDIITVEESFF